MRYTCPKCKSEYADPTIVDGQEYKNCMVCNKKINLRPWRKLHEEKLAKLARQSRRKVKVVEEEDEVSEDENE